MATRFAKFLKLLGLIINTNYMRSIVWLLKPRGLQKPTGDAERRMMIVVDVLFSSVFCNQVLCGFVCPHFLFDIRQSQNTRFIEAYPNQQSVCVFHLFTQLECK